MSAAFVLAAVAIIVSPGPDNLYVLTKGISQGRRAAIIAASGFASGLSVHTTLAVAGLSAVLMTSRPAFSCLKVAGAGYLVYLGLKAFQTRGLISLPVAAQPLSERRIFGQAFLMNVLNPKVAIFFLAFLPQFTRPERGYLSWQLLLLGVTFALLALSIFSLIGAFSAVVGRWIRTRPRLIRTIDYGTGVIFIGIGVRLLFAGPMNS